MRSDAAENRRNSPGTLRQRAEAMLRTTRTEIATMPIEDVQSLVHELQVHQMELEIQNEELRDAQVELAESRDRYSDLYEFAPVGYVTLDRLGKIVQSNLAVTGLLGIERRKLIGMPFSHYVDRDGQDQWYLHRQAVFDDTSKQTCQLPLRDHQGKLIWVWVESRGLSGEPGFVEQCHTALVNVTERVRAEQELRRLHDELERRVKERTSALAMLRDVASIANGAENIDQAIRNSLRRVCEHDGWQFAQAWLPASEAANELRGGEFWYARRPARFAPLIESISSAAAVADEGLIGRVFATGNAEFTNDVSTHVSFYDPTISHLAFQSVGVFPILVKEQAVGVLELLGEHQIEPTERLLQSMTGVGMLLGRVIEREHAAQALRASEEHHRAVLNSIPEAIVSIDRQGAIVDANPATERLFGYSEQELIGSNYRLLLSSQEGQIQAAQTSELASTPSPSVAGVRHQAWAWRKDGTSFSIEVEVKAVDELDLSVAVIHDVSERKALEKQVVDATTDEQRRIGQDIHDGIGQELTGLRYMAQTHAEILASKSLPEAKIAERISEWLQTVQRELRSIIRELVPVELDGQGLVAALQGLAERTTDMHDLRCSVSGNTSLTSFDTAQATQLFRIVQEAVGNAVKHADALQIAIRLNEGSDALRLQIADDGVGIDQQNESPAQFGLRTMAYRAGLIGADLQIESTPHGGTSITCVIPKRSMPAQMKAES